MVYQPIKIFISRLFLLFFSLSPRRYSSKSPACFPRLDAEAELSKGGRSGSFSGLFGISYSVQIFKDLVRIWITNLNKFGDIRATNAMTITPFQDFTQTVVDAYADSASSGGPPEGSTGFRVGSYDSNPSRTKMSKSKPRRRQRKF
ncbi:hypothetical protein YC2023_011086 [Brassica napus]